MFDFRAPDGYLYLTLCVPGTRRFIPNVVLHQHKIAFCAPICAPSTNAVRWTCPAHTPFIPYWAAGDLEWITIVELAKTCTQVKFLCSLIFGHASHLLFHTDLIIKSIFHLLKLSNLLGILCLGIAETVWLNANLPAQTAKLAFMNHNP